MRKSWLWIAVFLFSFGFTRLTLSYFPFAHTVLESPFQQLEEIFSTSPKSNTKLGPVYFADCKSQMKTRADPAQALSSKRYHLSRQCPRVHPAVGRALLSQMLTNSASDCRSEYCIASLRADLEVFPSSCNLCLTRPNLDWREVTAVANIFAEK